MKKEKKEKEKDGAMWAMIHKRLLPLPRRFRGASAQLPQIFANFLQEKKMKTFDARQNTYEHNSYKLGRCNHSDKSSA